MTLGKRPPHEPGGWADLESGPATSHVFVEAPRKVVHIDLDAVIVGGGFAGVYLLYLLRKNGVNAKIVEAGSGLGGVWHWDSYPGARVDSPYPIYALNIPEVLDTWTWTEHYPGHEELKRYFKHVDKVLDISKDTFYNTRVTRADFDEETDKWNLESEDGSTFTAPFFCSCIGFASRPYCPDWPGLHDFKGRIYRPCDWPAKAIDLKKKKVAVVGTGATGIQIAQTVARTAKQLTCFVRTPNICLPMQQAQIDLAEQERDRLTITARLDQRLKDGGGFLLPWGQRKVLEDTPEEREAVLEEAWNKGGFRPLFTYTDIISDQAANNEIYTFWYRKTRRRVKDPHKANILVPAVAPHPIAAKRASLEQDYYEQMDKPHVTLVDLKSTPISHLTSDSIVTTDGIHHPVDILALATGYDGVTGGFSNMCITGLNQASLSEKWTNPQNGVQTYLGLTTSSFPNFFFVYGPHSPTAYANGPSLVEPQAQWILHVITSLQAANKTRVNAKEDAERRWKEKVVEVHKWTLRDGVDSWYNGANIPGKKREPLSFGGGLPMYLEEIWGSVRGGDVEGWEGFEVS